MYSIKHRRQSDHFLINFLCNLGSLNSYLFLVVVDHTLLIFDSRVLSFGISSIEWDFLFLSLNSLFNFDLFLDVPFSALFEHLLVCRAPYLSELVELIDLLVVHFGLTEIANFQSDTFLDLILTAVSATAPTAVEAVILTCEEGKLFEAELAVGLVLVRKLWLASGDY